MVEAGKKEGPGPSTIPSSVSYQEVLGGGREAELMLKPGEVGTGKPMPPEMEGEQISQRK